MRLQAGGQYLSRHHTAPSRKSNLFVKKTLIWQHVFVPHYRFFTGRISGGAAASTPSPSVCAVELGKRSESMWWSSSTLHCLPHYGMPVAARLIPLLPPPLISAVDDGVQMSQLLICGDKPLKIDERHVLINAECLISVYREDYRRAASGGVASPLIMLPKMTPAKEMMKKKSIKDYLPLDIISKNVSCCSPLIEGLQQETMIIWKQPAWRPVRWCPPCVPGLIFVAQVLIEEFILWLL